MRIVPFPHPTLRHKSKPIKRVDAELKSMIAAMFDLMYQAAGIGLAANQVDLPLRLFVVNLEGNPRGQERVFINPVLSSPKGFDEKEEGCLSLPGLYAQVKRPAQVQINAYDLSGREINEVATGMLARVVQHETDHLDGVLFIDRLSETSHREVQSTLDEFVIDFQSRQQVGEFPPPAAISQRLAELEKKYCL